MRARPFLTDNQQLYRKEKPTVLSKKNTQTHTHHKTKPNMRHVKFRWIIMPGHTIRIHRHDQLMA